MIGGNTWSFGDRRAGRLRQVDAAARTASRHRSTTTATTRSSVRFPNLKEKPYFPGGRDINDIDTLEAQLQHTYHRRVTLWLSEFTISSDHNNRAFNFAVSRTQQARWLTAAFRLANSVNYVAGMGWFNLLDDPPTGRSATSSPTG